MKEQPLVYIILVNWNGLKDTLECLHSIKKVVYKKYKIVVIDNGSASDQLRTLKIRYPEIHTIRNNSNLGYCKANNQGIKYAINNYAKYILLLNNDTVVKKDFLNILVNYADKNSFKGVLTPKILYYKKNVVWAMGGSVSKFTSIPKMIGQGNLSELYKNIIEPDYASGCAFFVNTEVLKRVGLLDEEYFAYYEDTDLSFRIKRNGYKIRVIPDSIIWHKVSRSTNKTTSDKIGAIQSYYLAKNGLLFGKKNIYGIWYIAYLILQTFIKLPGYLLLKCRDSAARLAYVKGYIDGVKYINSFSNDR